MGQTVYKSDVGYRSILLYLFQLNYNYISAFVMSNTFQRTFQHLVDANTVLQSVIPPLPPLQRAPTQAPSSLPAPALSPPSTTDQEIKIIQGRTYSGTNFWCSWCLQPAGGEHPWHCPDWPSTWLLWEDLDSWAEWKSCQIPSCFLEPDGQSRDRLEQDKQLLWVLQQDFFFRCWTCSPNNLQLPVCRTPGASINWRQDALLQTWSTATEAKEEIFGEGY